MNNNKPGEYDAVIQPQPQTPVYGAVMGGIEGVKQRFKLADNPQTKIALLQEAFKYGEEGKEFIYLSDRS